DVALLGAAIAAVTARRARYVAEPGGERRKDRVEMLRRLAVAADHHAIAALEPPHPAARADVEIADAPRAQRLGAADIVLVEGMPAVDQDVAGCEFWRKLVHRILGCLAGRQHQPDGARLLELADEIIEPLARRRAFARKLFHGVRVAVIDHASVPV